MKKSLLVIAVIAMGVFALRSRSADVHAPDARLVTNRIWIDHLPKNDRDTVNLFVAITEEPFGIFQAASMWRGNFEGFRYEGHGDELRIVYPQTGERDKVTAHARECHERDMDFCLEIDGASRGVKRYYSREGWEIRNLDEAKRLIATLVR